MRGPPAFLSSFRSDGDIACFLDRKSIEDARSARKLGLVLGTLGRQGNPLILSRLQAALSAAGKEHILLLLSELSPAKVLMCIVDCMMVLDSIVACVTVGYVLGCGSVDSGCMPTVVH